MRTPYRFGIEANRMGTLQRQTIEKMLFGQQHRWPGVIENHGNAFARIGRIDGQIRSSGLENGHKGNDC